MNQAIKDAITDGKIADVFMTIYHGKLASDERRAAAVAIFDKLPRQPYRMLPLLGNRHLVKEPVPLGNKLLFHLSSGRGPHFPI